MTAPQTPPLSAEDAREAREAAWFRWSERDCAKRTPYGEAFREGWRDAHDPPSGPRWPAYLAGRRAARAYARTLAKGDADAAR